jgi:DNA mismatch endonuclease (patch repair protein)
MVDVVDPATRSRMMARIRARDTRPELALRKHLYRAGLRYRVHAADVPGRPDIAFPAKRAAIFVHGCFWHRHEGCHWCSTPASNTDFWSEKFDRNRARDAAVVEQLHTRGWRIAIVWECGLNRQLEALGDRIADWVRRGEGDFDSGLIRARNP